MPPSGKSRNPVIESSSSLHFSRLLLAELLRPLMLLMAQIILALMLLFAPLCLLLRLTEICLVIEQRGTFASISALARHFEVQDVVGPSCCNEQNVINH